MELVGLLAWAAYANTVTRKQLFLLKNNVTKAAGASQSTIKQCLPVYLFNNSKPDISA